MPAEPDDEPRYARATWLFGRALGLVFLVAFVSLHVQLVGLIGEHGIVPAADVLAAMRARQLGFADYPSLFWLFGAGDAALHGVVIVGELASLALAVGALPGAMTFLATLAYLSLHSFGGPFLSFQWDTLLLETGWLATLLLPWQPFHHPRRLREPYGLARWALYLLAFRLVFLSGVVKLGSGDETWRELTALSYHYWTQPLPNPLSWLAHQLPNALHSAATFVTLAIELVIPFAIFFGRRGRRVAFVGIAGLMAVIQLTGNYGFFNVLTVAIALPLLDDAAVGERLRDWLVPDPGALPEWRTRMRYALSLPLVLIVALGISQLAFRGGLGRVAPDALVTAIDRVRPYRFANGYGLFAVMTRVRREIVIEGSLDGEEWREYQFAHKPRAPDALPGQSAPHMPRLDWQMWFAALGGFRDSPWLLRFMLRLKEAQPDVLALLADDPFDGETPRFVRARLYDYRFGDFGDDGYWQVRELGAYGPTLGR